MAGRAKYQNLHLDEDRRRQSALERLQKQLKKLNINDKSALFLKDSDVQATPEHFKKKIAYVQSQIKILQDRILKKRFDEK
jgi:hypothetical protein